MRKIFTFSFLTVVFVLLSGPVLAGKVEVCEAIKHDPEYKGLYGLCNAYWNADEEGREDILRNFEKKAGPGGPTMPGLEPEAACPCWLGGENLYPVELAYLPQDSQVAGAFAIARYEFGAVQYVVQPNFCAYVNNTGGDYQASVILTTTDEEDAICVEDMVEMIARDF